MSDFKKQVEEMIAENKRKRKKKLFYQKCMFGLIAIFILVVINISLIIQDSKLAQGIWVLDSIDENGTEVGYDEVLERYEGDVFYKLNKEEELVIEILGQEIKGTWTQEGDVVILYYSSAIKELSKNGKTMTLKQGEDTYIFIKE